MIVKDIRTRNNQQNLEVYAISWADNKRIYYFIPSKDEGLFVIGEDEVEVIDPTINEKFYLRKGDYGNDILMHWAIYEDDLAYDLLEQDPEAIKEFRRRMSSSS